MENNTQKLETPVVLPRIFGPITLPSSCCNTKIKIMKYRQCIGFSKSNSRPHGIAPINGPKNGIILVIPMITPINAGASNPMKESPAKHNNPMIAESIIFPTKNPLNILSV